MGSISQVVRSAVKNFNVKEKTVNESTGAVDADKLATFTEKSSRQGKLAYLKNGHRLSSKSFSVHAGLLNYLKTRGAKSGAVGAVDQLKGEQMEFIETVKSVGRAGKALQDSGVEASVKFILNGDWEKRDAYRITPELAAHVRNIATALNEAQRDASAGNREAPALPNLYAL